MPAISITEHDFTVLAMAAMDAQAAGNLTQAVALDRIARMANAALTRDSSAYQLARKAGSPGVPLRWQDVPSVLDPVDKIGTGTSM